MKRIDKEAVSLFGRETLSEAQAMRLDAVTSEQAEQVRNAARRLRELSGRPSEQRAEVDRLDKATACLLCRWLVDKQTARKIITFCTNRTGFVQG